MTPGFLPEALSPGRQPAVPGMCCFERTLKLVLLIEASYIFLIIELLVFIGFMENECFFVTWLEGTAVDLGHQGHVLDLGVGVLLAGLIAGTALRFDLGGHGVPRVAGVEHQPVFSEELPVEGRAHVLRYNLTRGKGLFVHPGAGRSFIAVVAPDELTYSEYAVAVTGRGWSVSG